MSGLESSWNLLSDATFPKLLSLFIKKLQGKTWIIHFLKMIKKCHQFYYAYESLLISQPKFNWFSKNMSGLENSWNLLSGAMLPKLLSLFIKKLQSKTWIFHYRKKVGKEVLKGVSQKYLETLYASMPNHLQAVIDNPRSHIKYWYICMS